MTLTLGIAIAAFFTAVLSGVLGMAGGMVLMAILVLLVSVPAAMVLHGAIQGVSNGSRAFFLRQHIAWRVLPPYLLGSAMGVGAFVALALAPSQNLVLLLVGLFPWLARGFRSLRGMDITKPTVAVLAGIVTMPLQLLVGVSGPLLDTFFLGAQLDRHQTVATKAATQTIGHGLKIAYYGGLFTAAWAEIDAPRLLLALAAAMLGTRIGTLLLDRLSDATFRRVSEQVILLLGAVCAARGAWGYWAAA